MMKHLLKGFLMVLISYILFALAGLALPNPVHVNTIGQTSFLFVSLCLAALGFLWCGLSTCFQNAKVMLHS